MSALKFSLHVLGQSAAGRLWNKGITQTIRGEHYLKEEQLSPGVRATVTYKGPYVTCVVGKVEIVSVTPVTSHELNGQDVALGGFDTMGELLAALGRAGYRFKALSEYKFNKIRFTWS